MDGLDHLLARHCRDCLAGWASSSLFNAIDRLGPTVPGSLVAHRIRRLARSRQLGHRSLEVARAFGAKKTFLRTVLPGGNCRRYLGVFNAEPQRRCRCAGGLIACSGEGQRASIFRLECLVASRHDLDVWRPGLAMDFECPFESQRNFSQRNFAAAIT